MPAYSFKERFVPMVKDGSKPGTIRNFRKFPVMAGQHAHLYYGMRTKHCMKLIDPSPVIKTVRCIVICENGEVLIINTYWLNDEERAMAMKRLVPDHYDCWWLQKCKKDEFAWRDGFRHPDNPEQRTGCFDIMLKWWKLTNGLPFIGNHIIWGK